MLLVAIATFNLGTVAFAQDSYYGDEASADASAESIQAERLAPKVIVIAGTKKGKCTPEMPMPKPNTPYEIQLQATADKTFVLDSDDLGLHLKSAPGKTTSKTVTFNKGDYGFVCGDETVPANKRTQGMFMAM